MSTSTFAHDLSLVPKSLSVGGVRVKDKQAEDSDGIAPRVDVVETMT